MSEADNGDFVRNFYVAFPKRCEAIRKSWGRPLTFAEKVLFSHLREVPQEAPQRGRDTLIFAPDRVIMQDATAQMAMLQFMTAGLDSVQVPTTIHCDHLIRAEVGAKKDLERALEENEEVYTFLKSAALRYGIGFWRAGAGIIHQVVFEQHAFPGGMIVGTDSHTPNGGGLGMIAVGVGGADAVDVMAGLPWGLLNPEIIGVHLTGKLRAWASPKDIILRIASILKVKGGTGKVLEYFGSGVETISATGRSTITNMGAEIGATASIFPYDERGSQYLRKTARELIAECADGVRGELRADPEVEQDPQAYFDHVIEVDLNTLEAGWVGPHTPDLLHTVSEMPHFIAENSYPDQISAALIGSCTNSSYEDISRAAAVAQEALKNGLKARCPFFVTLGSDQVRRTVERDGFLKPLLDLGAIVLANACGPCIGQWKRDPATAGKQNIIVTSYNRNFRKRNDGNEETLNFIGSPELVTMAAIAGRITFNPVTDKLKNSVGSEVAFNPPLGQPLPQENFEIDRSGFTAPNLTLEERLKIEVEIDPKSDRLAKLEPFCVWKIEDFQDLRLLLKVKGKCTTDHISQAGVWLKYRGHLPNISNNMLLGAVNAFTAEVGSGRNLFSGEEGQPIPKLAADYKERGVGWIIVADENYGEGSSREHAAMEPRYLGCRAVIAKSFARIHETNLKKQGLLALTFVNPEDYEKISAEDIFCIEGIAEIAPQSRLILKGVSQGESYEIPLQHTLTADQVVWFKAGSALNSVIKR